MNGEAIKLAPIHAAASRAASARICNAWFFESHKQTWHEITQFQMNPDTNLRPDIIGGYDLSSLRAIFDQDDKSIIVASERQIFYYNVETGEQVGRANLDLSKILADERIIASDKLENNFYLFTNYGKMFIWNLETRDWMNELSLPLKDNESLVSCKMVSKRQYVYSIQDNSTNQVTLYCSMSRSERERPKSRDRIGLITSGELNTFDIGSWIDRESLPLDLSQELWDKISRKRLVTYIHGSFVYFERISVGEKFVSEQTSQRIANLDFTCVRANPKRGMAAVGDKLGRIFLYTGHFNHKHVERTKLHWHTLPVSDLCFSSTGNTLFSAGGESGCIVIWDLTLNNLGQKRVVPRMGMPVRFINCSNILNQLILTFEDNELQFMDTNSQTKQIKTFTRRTIAIYKKNDYKALRVDKTIDKEEEIDSVGLLWHSKTDTVVTNCKTGWLQFYSPKTQSRNQTLNFLKSNILSLEQEAIVIPSDITKAALTLDGDWLAFYETRDSENSFPDVKLHIWQRSSATDKWVWIQTADRLHASTSIVDLKFSPDGQFLVSVSEDGTFQVLHRICLDPKSNDKSKLMYSKGFVGNVPKNLPATTTFSQDSSVMAMSLKNDTTLIWMIVDPYKLVYECQLNQIETDVDVPSDNQDESSSQPLHDVLGLHFGFHKPSQSLAPLCEVRTNSIRIWNILNSQETMEYSVTDTPENDCQESEFTAAAFDQCPSDSTSLDHFAVSTKNNLILIFKLELTSTTRTLHPLIIVDGTLPFSSSKTSLYYTHMCFLREPILEIDQQCHQDPQILKLLNRLCLMNNQQELVSISDKLTIERQSASNSCNSIKTFDMTDLHAYFVKNVSTYQEETRDLLKPEKLSPNFVTEKQRKIRNRLEVQKMLKDLLTRIPTQNLPRMEVLGPMILDKLI